MKPFQKSQWIWYTDTPEADSYGEFVKTFTAPSGKAEVCLSCDSDYALWVNGNFVESNQYGDFEHYKIYDIINITPFLREGVNRLAVLVWHFGLSSQRYFPGKAGLIFEVQNGDDILAISDENTLARQSLTYETGKKKWITGQLGLSFAHDASKTDLWKFENCDGFSLAVVTEKCCDFYPRPIEKLQLLQEVEGREIRREMREGKLRVLFDLGREVVGLIFLSLASQTSQNMLISWGEHLDDDGWVPRNIGGRDFSFEYRTRVGRNSYFNPMLRMAGRYIEIATEEDASFLEVAMIPQVYPKKHREYTFSSDLDRRIYDICVHCLDLCMMEHYVDSPWREQCLYAFDSRNQMLCGYEVYEGGNAAYVRAALKLFSEDRRDDELLSICSPCGNDLTIPSFSLHWIVAAKEYLTATGDRDFLREIYPKLKSVLDVFVANRKDGLALRFSGENHWNFYDWSDYCFGHLRSNDAPEPDGALNCLLILALTAFEYICKECALPYPYEGMIPQLRQKTKETFYVPRKGLMTLRAGREEYGELATTWAVLAEVLTGDEARTALEKVLEGESRPCSLSMRIFKYDALMKTDKERYLPVILEEIRRDYGMMLEQGADCTWETLLGAKDFGNAGSLCHGWTAVPVRYLPKISR